MTGQAPVGARVDLMPTMRSERLPQQPLVRCERRAIVLTELFEQRSRALDVCEQEGDSAGRQLGRAHRYFTHSWS